MQACWYAVQCKGQESFLAARNLTNQGFKVFHPTIQVEKIRHGKIKLVEEPLFPYYLFVHLTSADNWRPIRSTRGVSKLVCSGNVPIKVGDSIIAALQEWQAEPPQELFSPGDEVLIVAGPLKGLKAIFAAKSGADRVVLFMSLLQQQQRLEVSLDAVRLP